MARRGRYIPLANPMWSPVAREIQAMSRRGWRAAIGAALALTACGCLGRASTFADQPPVPALSAARGSDTTRGQMPDAPSPPNHAVCHLLNLPVDRPANAEYARPVATIRAVVNGDLIQESEVQLGILLSGTLLQQLHSARTREEQEAVNKQAVEDLIERELLLQDAIGKLKRGGKQGDALLKKIQEAADEEFDKKMLRPLLKREKMGSRKELADYLRQRGTPIDTLRWCWERKWMADQYLFTRLDNQINRIGRSEVSEYYNSHRDEYTQPDSVDWQDIFLDAGRHASPAAAREFAEALMKRAKQGEDFAKLSSEYDNGESRIRKGAGKGHKHGEIFPPEAEPLLFQMHEGDMDILEVPHGFHIIHVVKRQYAGPIPFDAKVQKEIRDKIRNTVFLRERESIVKELKRKAVIDRRD